MVRALRRVVRAMLCLPGMRDGTGGTPPVGRVRGEYAVRFAPRGRYAGEVGRSADPRSPDGAYGYAKGPALHGARNGPRGYGGYAGGRRSTSAASASRWAPAVP
ncbi:hypothetical protein GCM10010389_26880 [Streptomyces echinoruber]|uniref:Uncharacterized protein n=1 Tax=Streptomyces echinoruber TaxID=68898 RepID=A0A918VBZ6_9ACTN|nr:hypothetical protein GCM10010389_26880 [Streptomyces echinoruber]